MSGSLPLTQRVFVALADGKLHSGQQLALQLGVTRSAVWKAVGALQDLGLMVNAATRRGYCLRRPLLPLDAALIAARLPAAVSQRVRRGAVCWTLSSTNTTLLANVDLPVGRYDYLLAEFQTAGRGRRARSWMAPPGGAICLSLSRQFAALPPDFGALSLAVGIAVRRALQNLQPLAVQLKWPNDLVVGGRKLGGILIEMRAEAGGPAYVVIGVGINVALGDAVDERVRTTGTRPTDLQSLGWRDIDRNRVAAAVIGSLVECIEIFERQGFAPFAAQWRDADVLAGQSITVTGAGAGAAVSGVALGIAADGALRVDTAGGERRFVSGEVSVRQQP